MSTYLHIPWLHSSCLSGAASRGDDGPMAEGGSRRGSSVPQVRAREGPFQANSRVHKFGLQPDPGEPSSFVSGGNLVASETLL